MADFTNFRLSLNTGSQGTPTWTVVANGGTGGANEIRFSDLSNQGSTASASWPYMTRPGAVQDVDFIYAFSADTTSLGYLGGGTSTPIAWANSNYNQSRLEWDAAGTFASPPIFTAYNSTSHAAITRNSPSGGLLEGNTTDTGGTARSYLKANMYGDGATTDTPGAAPSNAPTATDGTTGALTPANTAWLTNYQGLMADTDWIAYGTTPSATTAQNLWVMWDLWTGPNQLTGTHTPVMSAKYTYAARNTTPDELITSLTNESKARGHRARHQSHRSPQTHRVGIDRF